MISSVIRTATREAASIARTPPPKSPIADFSIMMPLPEAGFRSSVEILRYQIVCLLGMQCLITMEAASVSVGALHPRLTLVRFTVTQPRPEGEFMGLVRSY